MLRYKTKTRPGLVALYDIRPGNGAPGAGQFLQPQSPHGASNGRETIYKCDKYVFYSVVSGACNIKF